MSNKSCGFHDEDLEAQDSPLTSADNPLRRFRCILLMLKANEILISILGDPESSLALVGISSSAPAYAVLRTSNGDDDEDSESNGTVQSSRSSPQVSIDILSDENDVGGIHANIARIVRERDLGSAMKLGGVPGIAKAVGTDLETGIRGDAEDLLSRRSACPVSQTEPATATFFQRLLKVCNRYMIFLLSVSMVLSLWYWIKKEGLEAGWYEGFAILVGIIILVVCHLIRDFWYETPHELSEKESSKMTETVVTVVRGGCQVDLRISDLVMGDIAALKEGDQVPADGLYVSGEVLQLGDDLESIHGSHASGEVSQLGDDLESIHGQNPFMFYGKKVISGNGRMLVTSAGMNTEWGKMMSKVIQSPNKKPLQAQLDKIFSCTDISALLFSLLILVELLLRLQLKKEDDNPGLPPFKGKPSTAKDLMDVVKRIVLKPTWKISMFTTFNMLLVGITEGYPFIITLSLKYWNKKTLSGEAFYSGLLACATMGSVTAICIDKIGGLTLSSVQVKMCRIGEEDINDIDNSAVDQDVLDALFDGIYTSVLDPKNAHVSEEEGVLSWAALKLGMKQDLLKQSCTLVETKEVNSNEERSLVLTRKNRENETVTSLHRKGPAETILAQCSFYYDSKGRINDMESKKRMDFEKFIKQKQSEHLKTIAFAYKKNNDSSEENNLILIGLLGLKGTDWKETKKAVEACRNAGVKIIIVSRDKITELRPIACECGMVGLNYSELDANEFWNYTDKEKMDRIDQFSIMGNALPSDKLLLVEFLKQYGHTVAVIGARTDETPAIKQSHVGITMGTWSSKMARGASDIIILDGNFSFLETIMRYGRCAYENIQKYIQHALTMHIAGFLIVIITTGLSGDALITAIQLSIGNAIISIVGGLGLLTEPPAEKPAGKQPAGQGGKLVTCAMWRNIILQASYQVVILVTIPSKVKTILGISPKATKSLVFNSFIVGQVFNLFNCRKLEKKNIFQGIKKNHCFWVAVVVIMGLQAAFIEIKHLLGGSARLNCKQWLACLLFGMVSWLLDCMGKFCSDLITHISMGVSERLFHRAS